MTRCTRVAAIAAAMLLSAVPFGASASTASEIAALPGRALTLVAQDPWTPVGGDLHLGVRISTGTTDASTESVHLVASQALRSRTEFDRVVAGGNRGATIDELDAPLATLSADASGIRSLTIGLETSGANDPARLALQKPGVYPISVELRGADAATGTPDDGRAFTTFAVVTASTVDGGPQPLTQRLGVAWIWPLVEGPSTLPDGERDPAVARSLSAGGRLGRQAAALARAGDVPLTLVPGPETLEAWIARGRDDPGVARGAATVRDAASRVEVIATTYVPTDLPSLLRNGLEGPADLQIVRGAEALTALLSVAPVTTTALARPADDLSVTRLLAHGVQRVVVDGDALAPVSTQFTPSRPFQLRSADPAQFGRVSAVASDSALVALLAGSDAPALRAQRLLAGLSLVALEEPSASRAVVVASQSELAGSSAVFDSLLAGLRGNPWLEPMTIDDVFARVPESDARNLTVRALAAVPVAAPPVPASSYLRTQARLDAFSRVVGADDPMVKDSQRSLLLAESSTFGGADGIARASATLGHVDATVDGFLAEIRVPDPGTITLTSRAGEIPLTFRNDTGRKVRIVVRLASPKLSFPDGSEHTIDLAPRSTTLRIGVEARTSGTFPLRLVVDTEQGGLRIADTGFQVRSTVVSAVGITLMGGAALFLAAWWGLHIMRARTRRRVAATPS